MSFEIPNPIKCLISVDPGTKLWIGRCLDFGLVTSGKTSQSVWANLKSVTKLHIEHSFAHDRDGLHRHRAPDKLWLAFQAVESELGLSDKIELDLVPSQPPQPVDPIWIKGVELDCTNTAALQSVH